jgi:putative transposase
MPQGLVRYRNPGHLHFATFSCYRRQPFLRTAISGDLFEPSLLPEQSLQAGVEVSPYCLIPNHIPLILSPDPRLHPGIAACTW